jgi:3-hydroxyacyl-CoA dehydrogenase
MSPLDHGRPRRSAAAATGAAGHARQLFPEQVLGEMPRVTHTIWEGDEVRLWTLADDDGARRAGAVFQEPHVGHRPEGARRRARGDRPRRARLRRAGDLAAAGPFSVGANLKQIRPVLEAGDFKALDRVIDDFQQTSQAIKHAQVPVITAVQSMALGGGCEFVMHSPRAVVALESYIGLVEAGVGLIPAGGGCKEFASAPRARRRPRQRRTR